jgi:hypothetical protein
VTDPRSDKMVAVRIKDPDKNYAMIEEKLLRYGAMVQYICGYGGFI